VEGPQTYRCKDQETAVYGPTKMIVIPPHHYIAIANPVMVDERGNVVFDKYGQAILRHGDQEIRLEREPFPLYPGESIIENVKPLEVIEINSALRLQATRDFIDRYAKDDKDRPISRTAGSEWLFEGPNTYVPQPEVKVLNAVKATLIKPEQALRLTTSVDYKDRTGTLHTAGSEWHFSEEGVFLPSVYERVLAVDKPYILTDKLALHLKAQHRFTDAYGIVRPAGSEWLITNKITTSHIPHVFETVVGTVAVTTVPRNDYVIIQNHVENGKPQYGKKIIRRGEQNFFLQPGEKILQTKSVSVLTADRALLLQAVKPFKESTVLGTVHRKAGEIWMLEGPTAYWPPLEVKVLQQNIPPALQIGTFYIFRQENIIWGAIVFLLTAYILWKIISLFF